MTIRASKPGFNLREKLKELTHSVGLKGRELMRAATVQDARDLVSAGRKNLIINGAATVNQRGANSSISSGTVNFAADRWALEVDSAGTWNLFQAADGPPGFGFCHKVDCTTANASLSSASVLIFQQRLEGLNLQHLCKGTTDAKSLTFSFYVKSNKTGKYIVEFQDANNGRNCQRSYNINNADVWEYKTLTVPGDTTGALTNTNGHSFTMRFWLAAGAGTFQGGTLQTEWGSTVNANRVVGQVNLADSTSNEWSVTGVQLEVGKNATDFEHRSYGEELALCQRYFYLKKAFYAKPMWIYSTSAASTQFEFPTEMRANPTFTYTGTLASDINFYYGPFANYLTFTGFNAHIVSGQSSRINVTGITPAVTSGYAGGLYMNTSADLSWSAEL